jgi:carbonic anhydrase/acetyltransferase-like protein (isoleucine patch superfamily)
LLQGGVVHGCLLEDNSLEGLNSLLVVLVVLVGKALVDLLELVVVKRLVV